MYVLISETEAGRDLPKIDVWTVDDEVFAGLPDVFDLEDLREALKTNAMILGYTDDIREVKELLPHFGHYGNCDKCNCGIDVTETMCEECSNEQAVSGNSTGAVGLLDEIEDDLDVDDCLDRLVAEAQQYDTKLNEFCVETITLMVPKQVQVAVATA